MGTERLAPPRRHHLDGWDESSKGGLRKLVAALRADLADCESEREQAERREVTDEMIDRAAAAYQFGVMPGDESQATDEEIRAMAERVLRAALASPSA